MYIELAGLVKRFIFWRLEVATLLQDRNAYIIVVAALEAVAWCLVVILFQSIKRSALIFAVDIQNSLSRCRMVEDSRSLIVYTLKKCKDYCLYATLCLKNVPPLTCYDHYTDGSIATIFGTNVVEEVGNQNVLYFPTLPNYCFCTKSIWETGNLEIPSFHLNTACFFHQKTRNPV